MSTFDIISHQLVNGFVFGSYYALVALGYTIMARNDKVTNSNA